MLTVIRTGPSDSLRKYGLRGANRITWESESRHQRVGKGSQPKSMPAQLGCCRTAPLRPLLLQRADRRKTSLDASGPQRTPHVFASTLFVPLSRFFKRFRWRAKVVGSRAWSGGPSMGRGWQSRPPSAAGPDGPAAEPVSCQASTISCHISWRSSSRAVTWEFTQLRSSAPRRKDRTEFLFRVSRKRRRATGRRPSEARARGCDREL